MPQPPTKHRADHHGEPIALRDHQTAVVLTLGGIRIYTTALDEDGQLWERWSNDPPGAWHHVKGPSR